MYNEILKDRMEAATLLLKKLKVQNTGWLYLEEVYRLLWNCYLQLPDVVLSKKIGHPFNKEFAIEPSRWILPL
jgi:hypothetical protein